MEDQNNKINLNDKRTLTDHAIDILKTAGGVAVGLKAVDMLSSRKGLTGGGGRVF